MIHEIWQADIRESAEQGLDRFIATFGDKYPWTTWLQTASGCWPSSTSQLPIGRTLRTTKPIESTFATIRLTTAKTRNCYSVDSGLALIHQLAMSAQKRWRRLHGFEQLADVIAVGWSSSTELMNARSAGKPPLDQET